MSSTTDSARGQVLAIFALSLTALLGAAALAFDAGLLYVERRDQQNAADAAALAGAHYLPDNATSARSAALDVALRNGYEASMVTVTTPYLWSGKPSTEPSSGFIEVRIADTRPSFFAGVLGFLDWSVSARAVAANEDDVAVEFSILSLNPTACPGLEVAGGGLIDAAGDVHVDSDCDKGALKMVASGTSITVEVGGKEGACSAVGSVKGDIEDKTQFACEVIESAPWVPDPFELTPEPPTPPTQPTPAMEHLRPPDPTQPFDEGLLPPDGCPGSDAPATTADPGKGCQFSSSSAYDDEFWLVHPGIYPGGLKLNSGTFYLLPGVYYIEGGGIDLGGGGVTIKSVEADGITPGGGVLIYNTEGPNSPAGAVNLNGRDADIYLEPYEGSPWDGFVVFQDRTVAEDIEINGSDSEMSVRGTIYAKLGHVKINGSAGVLTLDQIIADTFYVSGGGGTIDANLERDFVPSLTIAGLVE